jgi:Mlc titration factor MtfA (ptsG expression regulator)
VTDVVVILGACAVVAWVALRHALGVRRSRAELAARRLTAPQRQLVERLAPVVGRVPESLRDRHEGLMHVFIGEKSFEACGGLAEVTEEMRLVIAAQACLLVLANGQPLYPQLRSILVYPDAYRVRDEWGDEDVRLGESWGLNVTLHEFAHQLDQADGAADGLPELDDWHVAGSWAGAFGPAYRDFCEDVRRGRRTVMDSYGASDPAEFFAVASETFFEKPVALAADYPELYEELRTFYQLDPRGWRAAT